MSAADDRNSRYIVKKYPVSFTDKVVYGVVDLGYNPERWVDDWRSKGTRKRAWRSDFASATDLATQLNKTRRNPNAGTTSLTQVIHHANNQRKKKARTIAQPFKKCQCGAMFKGDMHCGN